MLVKGIECKACKDVLHYSDELVFFLDGEEVCVSEQYPDWDEAVCITCHEEGFWSE